jgi:cob(I)alamin adenosyltransferase
MEQEEGSVYVFTGSGKGKTTASLGQAIRARGHGWKVLIVQFIKKVSSGEVEPLRKFGIEIYPTGLGFVRTEGSDRSLTEHRSAAKRAFDFAKDKVKDGRYNLLILDEVNVAVGLGLLEEREVLDFLKEKPRDLSVILTGRDAPESFIKTSDLVTEMKEVKHPFTREKSGRSGLEY